MVQTFCSFACVDVLTHSSSIYGPKDQSLKEMKWCVQDLTATNLVSSLDLSSSTVTTVASAEAQWPWNLVNIWSGRNTSTFSNFLPWSFFLTCPEHLAVCASILKTSKDRYQSLCSPLTWAARAQGLAHSVSAIASPFQILLPHGLPLG